LSERIGSLKEWRSGIDQEVTAAEAEKAEVERKLLLLEPGGYRVAANARITNDVHVHPDVPAAEPVEADEDGEQASSQRLAVKTLCPGPG
jgi:hypothetical protein